MSYFREFLREYEEVGGGTLKALDLHRVVAIDFDDTLLYGSNSEQLQQYILDNPDKTYFIVTFRTPRLARSIPDELAQHSNLDISLFEKVVPCSERFVMEFEEDQKMRKAAGMSMLTPETPVGEMFAGENKFVHWKGYVCYRLGATILVDDMPALVLPGLKRHNVAYLNIRQAHAAPAELNAG